jgi:TonB family protein
LESKFNTEVAGWKISLLSHFLIFLLFRLVLWLSPSQPNTIRIQVIDSSFEPRRAPMIQMQTKPKTEPKNRSHNDMNGPKSPQVKTGNTSTKTADNFDVRKGEDESLPIPKDDYLVTSMPVLDNEYRIPYPTEAKKKNISGVVVMDLLIDKFGKVREVKLFSGPGGGLDEAAMEAVKNFRFVPAMIQNQAVAVKIRYGYRFVLER